MLLVAKVTAAEHRMCLTLIQLFSHYYEASSKERLLLKDFGLPGVGFGLKGGSVYFFERMNIRLPSQLYQHEVVNSLLTYK